MQNQTIELQDATPAPAVKLSFEEGAKPIHILRRLIEHTMRDVDTVPLWALAAFATTKTRALATLHALQQGGFVVPIDGGWKITCAGVDEYSRLTRELETLATERRKLTCSGWTQPSLF